MTPAEKLARTNELVSLLNIASRAVELLECGEDIHVEPDTVAHARLWNLARAVEEWKHPR